MDDKKKIVLATEDIIDKNLDDIFINIDLKRTFNEIKRDRFDNNFDLAQQFRKERNESRSFRIYGIIDSIATDCDNLELFIYSDSSLTQLITTINSTPLGFGDLNIFNKSKGKYIIELDNYTTSDDIWIKILGNGINYVDSVFQQKLVFYGADGQLIEYGTETVDIGVSGSFVEINNDFPFFYDKHWIKKNIQIDRVNQRNISFGDYTYSVNEGNSIDIDISLSEPSIFGNESVDIIITTPFTEEYETAAPILDFNGSGFTFPITVTWSAGEQTKNITISSIPDFIYEKNIEFFNIALVNNQNATINQGVLNISETSVEITNQDEARSVIYNLQKIINNTAPLKGDLPDYKNSLASLVGGTKLNSFGAKYNGILDSSDVQNHRFYPNDKLEIEITNRGNTTILPAFPQLSNNQQVQSEQLFQTDDSVVLYVNSSYQNQNSLPLEKAVFNFKYQNIVQEQTYVEKFYINGIEFGPTYLVANNFVSAINNVYNQLEIDIPFTISQSGKTVTLTATHPVNSINAFIPSAVTTSYEWQYPSGNVLFPVQVAITANTFALENDLQAPEYPDGRITDITEQIPFKFALNANFDNNSECRYEFKIRKPGYKEVTIPVQEIPATTSGNEVFLVSGIKDVVGPSLLSSDPAVCDLSQNQFNSTGYYLNGLALVSAGENYAFQLNTYVYEEGIAINSHSSGFVGEFRNTPLSSNIINCNGLIELSSNLV